MNYAVLPIKSVENLFMATLPQYIRSNKAQGAQGKVFRIHQVKTEM